MTDEPIPPLSDQEIDEWFARAARSPRRRIAKILHAPGMVFNEVFNFILQDSYMQPHLHPSAEKIERIYLIRGAMAVLFFDDRGAVTKVTVLQKGRTEFIEVPAFTWHTYVMLDESVVSYETMMGEYDPKTWKEFAEWAPLENSDKSVAYLAFLKTAATNRMPGTLSRNSRLPI